MSGNGPLRQTFAIADQNPTVHYVLLITTQWHQNKVSIVGARQGPKRWISNPEELSKG